MEIFLPLWKDVIDLNYDYKNDEFSEAHKKDKWNNDVYPHQIYEQPYDGILYSLAQMNKRNKITNIKKHFNTSMEVMGDCGAFSYVNEPEPPQFYSPSNVAKIYNELGFDCGVAPDHLCVDKLLQSVLNARIKLTLKNAEEFIKYDYDYIPIGTAQGYNIETYKNSVKQLIDIGYEYIAIGSIVNYKTDKILEILRALQPLPEHIKLHLFGVIRPDVINEFEQLGVVSVDSTSYLRKAWGRPETNYILNDDWYSAIKVPYVSNPRTTKKLIDAGYTVEYLAKLEQASLKSLRKYARGEMSIDDTLSAVMEYNELFINEKQYDKLYDLYYKTLNMRVWEKCNCKLCRMLGIEIVIFRGANRNRARGFHNINELYKSLKVK